MATAPLGTVLRHIERLVAGRDVLEWTDRRLLDDFAARRDETAFAALVARHGPMVLRVCRRLLHHEQDAEDAFQATFLVLARNGASIRKREAVADWLHGVAYRTAMKAKRSAARRRNHEGRLKAAAPTAEEGPTWEDVQAILDEEIQRLSQPYRAAFVLCVLEGKSGPEAAAVLGCKGGTVSSRLTRARQQLQQRLARRGVKLSLLLAALAVAEDIGKAGVPLALIHATVRNRLLVAAGGTAAGLIPSHVAILAEGVTKAMFLTKMKITTAVLLIAGLVAAGTGAAAYQALAADKPDRNQEAPKQTARKSEAPPPRDSATAVPEASKKDEDLVSVKGQVLDPDGKALAGVKVYCVTPHLRRIAPEGVRPDERFSLSEPPAARATTDADGRFAFSIKRSEYLLEGLSDRDARFYATVVAVSKGYGFGCKQLVPSDMHAGVTLKLIRDDVPIQGRIVNLEGKPVAGATVKVEAVIDTRGGNLKPWLDALQADGVGRFWEFMDEVLEPAAVGVSPHATTNIDGRFWLGGIGRERLLALRIEGPTIQTQIVYARTRLGETVRVTDHRDPIRAGTFVCYGATFDHAAAPTRPIVGTVRDKDTGAPLAGVVIQSQVDFMSIPYFSQTTTDREGKYRFVGQSSVGEHDVLAIPPKGAPYLVSNRKTASTPGLESARLDFELKRGVVIRGRVADGATGKPLQATVDYFAFVDNPQLSDFPGFRATGPATATTGDDGSFMIVGMPGRGLLAAKALKRQISQYISASGAARIAGLDKSGYFRTHPYMCQPRRYNSVVEINPAKDAKEVSCPIALNAGKTVIGTIVGLDGKPSKGVSIFPWESIGFAARELASAQFEIPGIDPQNPQPYFFLLQREKLGAAVLIRGDEPKTFTVRLEPCAVLTGRLTDEDGKPQAGKRLVGYIEGGQLNALRGRGGFFDATTDKDGRFRIEGVIPHIKVSVFSEVGSVLSRLGVSLTPQPGEIKDLGDIKIKMAQ